MTSRKRLLARLRERYLISITPIPRIHVRIRFRPDGSWTWYFGYRSDNTLGWEEKRKSGHYGYAAGDSDSTNMLWRYIKECAYKQVIHPLDLVQ